MGGRRKWLGLLAGVLLVAPAAAPAPALGSAKITSAATNVRLAVIDRNTAVVTYNQGGRTWSTIARGAINARFPSPSVRQVGFRVKYSQGGGAAQGVGSCLPYNGPALGWVVAACRGVARDYWVVQAWQRNLRNYGEAAQRPQDAEFDLRLSHWRGPLPVFTLKLDWAFAGRFDHMYGSLTYKGRPMYGFGTTSQGAPTDKHGILIYVDTLDSAYGSGWRRENSFVTHNPSGIFCYGFFPHPPHPSGKGSSYRATAIGPGVLPDLLWQGAAPGPYDPEKDAIANAEQLEKYSDRSCRPN